MGIPAFGQIFVWCSYNCEEYSKQENYGLHATDVKY